MLKNSDVSANTAVAFRRVNEFGKGGSLYVDRAVTSEWEIKLSFAEPEERGAINYKTPSAYPSTKILT
jgi:hypothetical protein